MRSTTPVLLVWPDPRVAPDEASALRQDVDADVLVAAWNPDADDAGRNDLLTSLRDARATVTDRGGDPDALTLIGFGLGAVAAAGLTRYAKRLGIGLGRVLCIAPTWNEPDPFSGRPLGDVPERVELVADAASAAASLTCWRPR